MLEFRQEVDEVSDRAQVEEAAEVQGATLAPELARYIGYLVRRVYARFSADPSHQGLRTRDFAVLAALAEHDGSSQQGLAGQLGINRTIMVKLIERLERVGYVTRVRNPDNRRSYVLSLTDAGRAAQASMRRAVAERDERLTAALGPQERARLHELLRSVLPEPERGPEVSSTEHLISQVHFFLRRLGDSMVAEVGLRMRHYGPLSAIDKFGPCPQQQLARYLAINEPAAAQLVDELVQTGLVARGQDPTDRRRYALTLTDLGRERLATVREAGDRMQAQLAASLGPDRDEELRGLLGRLLPVEPTPQPAGDRPAVPGSAG